MSAKLLVVEDNNDMRDTLASFLESEGFDVMAVPSCEEGIDAVDENSFELALVDINLPGKSGFDLVEYIRDQGIDMPLIALTARDGVNDKITGFNKGLNDYVVKPFDLRELRARVQAHIKHSGTGDEEAEIVTPSFKIQPKSLRFYIGENEVTLTQLEFRMMHLFMKNHDTLVQMDDLIEHVWSEDDSLVTPPVRIHIANLRKKIGDSDFRVIKTIPGVGYIFSDQGTR